MTFRNHWFFILLFIVFISNNGYAISLNKVSINSISVNDDSQSISIISPSDYQVFQRADSVGTVIISGTYSGYVEYVEARYNLSEWQVIDNNPSGGSFSGELTDQGQGQGTLEVRFSNNHYIKDEKNYVGIGDIFLMTGQSNMTGHADNNQVYSSSGIKACLFGNDYKWKELADPFDSETNQVDSVSNDDLTGEEARGSWIPVFATYFISDQNVPVAFVPCSKGSTTISNHLPGSDHLDRSTLYGSCNYRAVQIGGYVKAVLFEQGETDANVGTSEAVYNSRLDTLADSWQSDRGIKIMPCLLQAATVYSEENIQAIRDAVTTSYNDNINVIIGPDLSDIVPSDGVHFRTDAQIQEVGYRWWVAVKSALY